MVSSSTTSHLKTGLRKMRLAGCSNNSYQALSISVSLEQLIEILSQKICCQMNKRTSKLWILGSVIPLRTEKNWSQHVGPLAMQLLSLLEDLSMLAKRQIFGVQEQSCIAQYVATYHLRTKTLKVFIKRFYQPTISSRATFQKKFKIQLGIFLCLNQN